MAFVEKTEFFGNSRSRLFTIHTCEAGADLVPDAMMRTSIGGETLRIGETAILAGLVEMAGGLDAEAGRVARSARSKHAICDPSAPLFSRTGLPLLAPLPCVRMSP